MKQDWRSLIVKSLMQMATQTGPETQQGLGYPGY